MAGKRDVNLNVTATEETGPAFDAVDRNIDKTQRKVDGFNTKKPTAEVVRFTSAFTKSAKDGDSAMTTLQKSIDDTEKRIAKLRADFNQPGSNGVQLFGDLKSAERDLKSLQAAFKSVVGDIGSDGSDAGKSFTQAFSKEASTQLPKVLSNPELLAAVGFAASALAVPVGTAIEAAVSGAVGLGVLAGAALIQRNNPRLVAALTPFERDVEDVFKGASESLVSSFVDSLDSLDGFVKSEGPQLAKLFDAADGAVGPLTSGIEYLTADLLPALTKDTAAFSESLKDPALRSSVAGTERSFVALFNTIGDHPQVIADGFRAIGDSLHVAAAVGNTFFVAVDQVDTKLHDAYAIWLKLTGQQPQPPQVPLPNGGASNGFEQIRPPNVSLQQWEAQKNGALGAAEAFNGVASALNVYAQAARTAVLGTVALDSTELDAAISANDFNSSVTNLIGTLKTNKESLKEHTAAGEADIGAILGIISAQKANIPLWEKQGLTVDEATKKFNTNLTSLERQLASAHELTPAIQSMIDKYLAIPDNVTTVLSSNEAEASKAIDKYKNGIEEIPTSKTTTLHVVVDGDINQAVELAHATGHQVAFGAGDYLDPGFAFGPNSAAGGKTAWTMPPTQVDVHNRLESSLILDGQIVARSVRRTEAAQRHAQRVGAL